MTEYKYCCFTGHRPDKLADEKDSVIKCLRAEIENAINDGFNCFITGMAPGVDVWAAECVIDFQRDYDIKLICAVPFPGFCDGGRPDKKECEHILSNAFSKECISSHYYPAVFQVRNKWMVDKSELVIAVFNGTKGGTKNTVDYARRKGVKVVNTLYPETFSI